jgi:hypothetical protein
MADPTTKHRIRILSLFGMSDPSMDFARRGVWEGTVELPAASEGEAALDQIFRLFNRVSQEDADRLERWGYFLPSLSVGDIVGIKRDGEIFDLWRVVSAGFEPIFPGIA